VLTKVLLGKVKVLVSNWYRLKNILRCVNNLLNSITKGADNIMKH